MLNYVQIDIQAPTTMHECPVVAAYNSYLGGLGWPIPRQKTQVCGAAKVEAAVKAHSRHANKNPIANENH